MIARKTTLPALVLAGTGCISDVRIDLPQLDASTRSLIFAIEPDEDIAATPDALLLFAFDREELETSGLELRVVAGKQSRFTALIYGASLAEMQIDSGQLILESSGRPIPTSEAVLVNQVRDGDAGGWQLGEVSARIAGARIPSFDWTHCVNDGGCFDELRPERCSIPCPAAAARTPPAAPQLPQPPEAPHLDDCPNGWTVAAFPEDPAAKYCVPPPPVRCPIGQAQLPGGDGSCEPVGSACPNDQWPPAGTAGRAIYYVDADAPPGGDGSMAAPFVTIGEALAVSPPSGALIAVGSGVYAETVRIGSNVSLIGECAADTIIEADGYGILADGDDIFVRDLTVSAGVAMSIGSSEPTTIDLEAVIADGERVLGYRGIVADRGAVVTGRRVVARNFQFSGIEGIDGAHVALVRTAVERIGVVSITMGGDNTQGIFEGLSIVEPTSARSVAVHAVRGGKATMNDAQIDGGFRAGIYAEGGLARVEVDRAYVRGLVAGPDGPTAGIFIVTGSSGDIRRTTVADIEGDGIVVSAAGATMADVRVHSTRFSEQQPYHSAAGIQIGSSTVTASRLSVRDTDSSGIRVYDGFASISDVEVVETSASMSSACVQVYPGAKVDLLRAKLAGCRATALYNEGALAADDVSITGATPADPEHAQAIAFYTRTPVSSHRIHIARTKGAAIVVDGNTAAAFFDLTISDTVSGDETFPGFAVSADGELHLERALIERTSGDAISITRGPESRLVAQDLVVRESGGDGISLANSTPNPFGSTTLSRALFEENEGRALVIGIDMNLTAIDLEIRGRGDTSTGIAVAPGTDTMLERFLIRDTGLAFDAVLAPADVLFENGEISHNRVGVQVPSETDLAPFCNRVAYRANGDHIFFVSE